MHPDASPPAHTDRSPRSALIGAGDLSAAWIPQPRTASGLACTEQDPFRGATKRLQSPRFHRESVDIQQTLGVYADEAASGRAYRRLDAPVTQRCMSRALRRWLRFGAGDSFLFVGRVTVVRTESLGHHSSGIRYTAKVASELARGNAYIVTINSRIGRAAASLIVAAGLGPLAEAAYDQLAAAAERQLEAVYG